MQVSNFNESENFKASRGSELQRSSKDHNRLDLDDDYRTTNSLTLEPVQRGLKKEAAKA